MLEGVFKVYSPLPEYPAAARLELADISCCGELHLMGWDKIR